MQGCCLASPICVVSPFLGGSSPKWENSPLFFDPAQGPWRTGSALRASPARLMKGGVKTRGTFPIWLIRHLCQQFQSQGLNIKTASKAERKSILERFCVRNEPSYVRNRSACGAKWNPKSRRVYIPFFVRSRSARGTVLRAEQNGTRKAGEYI